MRSKEILDKMRQITTRLWQNPEYRERLRQSHLGHQLTAETKRKMSEAQKQRYKSNEVRAKHKAAMSSPQTRAKLKLAGEKRCNTEEYKNWFKQMMKQHYQNPEYKERMSQIAKTCHLTPQAIEKSRISGLKRFSLPEAREQLSLAHKGKRVSQATKQRMSDTQTKRYANPSAREAQSKRLKLAYQSPHLRQMARERILKVLATIPQNKRDEWIKNSISASHTTPNKPETILMQLLNTLYPNEWKFVGDGKVIICGRSPDFINTNGLKSVILLHGVYWHLERKQKDEPTITRERVEQRDINFYKTYGWNCLIIWEDELNKPQLVIDKIKQFVNKDYLVNSLLSISTTKIQ